MADNLFDNRAPRDPTAARINDPIRSREVNPREGNSTLPNIIADNPQTPVAQRQRQLMIWRVPSLGFVQMYINPQSFQLDQQKIIKKQRTKGGYIIQYWGEELPKITINGHTGSSGIEGINILEQVYRAEQNAFEQVAETLTDRLRAFSIGGNVNSIVQQASKKAIGDVAGNTLGNIIGNGANPPLLPTLASLAVAVELFYQGWVFKGYFESFSVTESTSQGVGLYSYNMVFNVLDRRGIRRNSAPWHRRPADFDARGISVNYRQSDANSVPMNFGGEEGT